MIMGWTLRQWIIAAAYKHCNSFYDPQYFDIVDAAKVQAYWRTHQASEPGLYLPEVLGFAITDEDREWAANVFANAEQVFKDQIKRYDHTNPA